MKSHCPLDRISDDALEAIRGHVRQHLLSKDETECEEFLRTLFRIIAGEIESVIREERCWFYKRIGRPCRQ